MKRKKRRDSQHHRQCRSNGGTDEPENISWVNVYEHNAWHLLFRNWEAEKIAEVINDIWLDSRFEFVVRRKNG